MKGKVYIGTAPEVTFVGFGDASDIPLSADHVVRDGYVTLSAAIPKGTPLCIEVDAVEVDARWPSLSVDPALPGADKTVYSDFSKGVCISFTEDVAGDIKRFFDAVLESSPEEFLDPWADTLRLNEQGRSVNPERDAEEVYCRRWMKGRPVIVTKAQGRKLAAIEFDQALYVATDNPFQIAPRAPAADPVKHSKSSLRNRWGQPK